MKKINSTAGKTANKKIAKAIKPLYPVSRLTKNSAKNLWVVFEQGNRSNGIVYSSVMSRDNVRVAYSKMNNVHFNDTRSQRVSTFIRRSK